MHNTPQIYIATDHAGFHLKESLKTYILSLGYSVLDMGADVYDSNDDYTDFVYPCALRVAQDKNSFGIIFGGSGQAEMMCANKVAGVRAGVFYGSVLPKEAVDVSGNNSSNPLEIVKLLREHNNANVLSLGARFLEIEEAKQAVKLFLETPFTNEKRHIRRINKLEH